MLIYFQYIFSRQRQVQSIHRYMLLDLLHHHSKYFLTLSVDAAQNVNFLILHLCVLLHSFLSTVDRLTYCKYVGYEYRSISPDAVTFVPSRAIRFRKFNRLHMCIELKFVGNENNSNVVLKSISIKF